MLVLLPFWTSLIVRTASWIVLLQSSGLINQSLLGSRLIEQPLALVFNRAGVYISMTHILLPFIVLPLYAVMKGISPQLCPSRHFIRCASVCCFLACLCTANLQRRYGGRVTGLYDGDWLLHHTRITRRSG